MSNQFQQHGILTAEGQRVIEWMENQCALAEGKDIDAINSLSGPTKHYYVNVVKLKLMPAWRWLEDFGNAATSILRNITEAEAEQAKAQESSETISKLSESLEEVKAALALAMAKIAQMEAEAETAETASEMAGEGSAPTEEAPAKRGKRV